MEKVELELNSKGQGAFFIKKGAERIAYMEVAVSGGSLTVYHTEVLPEAEGQGLAKKLLSSMVGYAREKGLKVIPLCPYVYAQFKRHPDDFADLWKEVAGEE